MYDKVITICNKLKKSDTVEKTTDLWVKTVLTGCEHKKTVVKSVSGSTVSFGQTVTVLIPFGKGYIPYDTWKLDTTKGFTISLGDVIFLDLSLTEIPTSSNIATLKSFHSAIDCKVVEIADSNGIAKVQVKIEGV